MSSLLARRALTKRLRRPAHTASPHPRLRWRLHGVLGMQPGLSGLRVAPTDAHLARPLEPLAGRPAVAGYALPGTAKTISMPPPSGVRQHPMHLRGVGRIHRRHFLQAAHTIGRLGSQQVPLARVHSQHLAGGSHLESLCRAPVRLEFPLLGHVFKSLPAQNRSRSRSVRISPKPLRGLAAARGLFSARAAPSKYSLPFVARSPPARARRFPAATGSSWPARLLGAPFLARGGRSSLSRGVIRRETG